MFNSIFNKKKSQPEVQKHLKRFQEAFTNEQKKAIMCSLYVIATSDGEFHNTEQYHFEQTASLLDYELTTNYVDEFLTLKGGKIYQVLNSLNESQKDWYIVTAVGMLNSDGKSLNIEQEYLQGILLEMNITLERFKSVLTKAEFISESMNF